jgi:putative ABC transport system permease protein
MRKLDRKLLRDLIHLRGQAVAISLVIASGVATFVMALCAYASLQSSKQAFYRDFRFADVFTTTQRSPKAILPRIRQISGVAEVEARLVYDVLMNIQGMSEPATARLISIPDSGEGLLNQVYISRGRMLEPERTGEVVVSEVFAEAHGFVVGDTVRAIINGRLQQLRIVGVALSPEYVIQIKPGSILPDNKRFGVFWISERDLEAAFDMTGAFNSLALKLAYGHNTDEVIAELDQLLEPFGSIGAYTRDDHLSHQYLTDELSQLRGMAIWAPSIFLSVAAFLLNIVVTRIIVQQREQIAALKAFGYTNWEVGFHYLNLVMIISLAGTLLGILLGFWMATNITQMYQKFYKFPLLQFRVNMFAVLSAVLLTTASAAFATWFAVRRAIQLPPAEAMRPESPPSYRTTLLEQCIPRTWLTAEMRMVIRNIGRKPLKASFSMLGIAMAVSVMILGSFSLDSMNYMMNFQFRKAQRQDLTVIFVEPTTAAVMYEMEHLPGVLDSETMRSVPARLHFQQHSRRVGLTGLEPNPRLYRLLNRDEREVRIPEFGVMLNSKLAELLHVQLGDELIAEVLDEKRPTLNLEVTAIVEEYAGLNAYVNKHYLHRLLEESNTASGAYLKVDPNRIDNIFRELQLRPGVASVTIKDATMESFSETVAENILVMRSFIVIFAGVIAVGVVYNSARISLSERSRDLATMRVVGFTRREVSMVLLGEIAVFTITAIPVGWLLGYIGAAAMVSGLDTDNYRIPLIVSRETLFMAAAVVVLATLCSGYIVQRRINQLDLVGVLKTRE